jgi:hypothetical protein
MLQPDELSNFWNSVLRTHTGSTERLGAVSHVQDDCIRVICGIRPDGSPLISPWLRPGTQSGVNREKHTYEIGQNVNLSSIAGSFRNALVNHWAPNNSHPSPPQSQQVNGHSGIVGKFAFSYHKSNPSGDYADHQINNQAEQNPQYQQQSGGFDSGGGGGGGQQGGQQQGQAPQAAMKSRLHEKTFITHRVGKNVRVAVSDKEAIVMFGEEGENTVFCDDEGCHSTKPLTVKKPQSQIDND